MRVTKKQLVAWGYPAGSIQSGTKVRKAGVLPITKSSPLRIREASEQGPWQFTMPGLPANLNSYLWKHWSTVSRAKKATKANVEAACIADRVPRATTKLRVSIVLSLPKGRQAPDEDNLFKSLRDGLAACGAIVDDSPLWLVTGTYTSTPGPLATTVILEEVES